MLVNRRSGFLNGVGGVANSLMYGADEIKAHPWFRSIDFATIHLQKPPFVPKLKTPEDTRYFDADVDPNPLPPPEGHVDNTKDPMLRDKVHGQHLLEVRKQLAFMGYTYKSPKKAVFDPRTGIILNTKARGKGANAEVKAIEKEDQERGRTEKREGRGSRTRAMSL